MRQEAEIIEIARREASPEHLREFEPVTKGLLFAVVALIPLGVAAGFCLLWRRLQGLGGEKT
jgi:hypothetical protein